MKKEQRNKLIFLTVFSLLFLTLAISLIAAEEPALVPEDTTSQLDTTKIGDSFRQLFSKSGWLEGNLAPSVAKIFFFVMIGLLISVLLTSVFPKFNQPIIILISFIVAFLGTAFLTPADVYSLLNSYTALGLTITTLVPIIILGALTYLGAERANAQLIILSWIAWGLFVIYSAYRLIYDMAYAQEGSGFVNIVLLITAIASAIMFIMHRRITHWLSTEVTRAEQEAANATVNRATGAISEMANMQRQLGTGGNGTS